jgi:hypothetical protein
MWDSEDLAAEIDALFGEAERLPDGWGQGHVRDIAYLETTAARQNAAKREAARFKSGLERKARNQAKRAWERRVTAELRVRRVQHSTVYLERELHWCSACSRFERCHLKGVK